MSENTVQEEVKPFDLVVHVAHPQTKKIIKVQPYIRHAERLPEGGSRVIYERDGKFYHENNGEVEIREEDNFVLKGKKAAEEKKAENSEKKPASFIGR